MGLLLVLHLADLLIKVMKGKSLLRHFQYYADIGIKGRRKVGVM